jgi:hypothetical protein
MKNVLMFCSTAFLLMTGTAEGGIQPEPFSPLLGGGLGQTLRITITGAGDLCQATLGFRDMRGAPIQEDGRVRTVTLKKGQTAFHELNFNAYVNRLGQRFEVRAVVTQDPAVPSSCRWSAEIYDQFSKRTTLIYTPVPEDSTPVPEDGHLPPIGGAFGQTLRFAVASPVSDDGRPALPCAGQLDLHSSTGALLATKTIRLMPGQGDFLDLSMNGLVRFGERAIIDPYFMPAPASAAGCKLSLQVFDQYSGWTQAFMEPIF